MARPPEHIRIKRRREEEPIETLYFQTPHGHDSKRRRFTDFVFQRVLRDEERQPLFGAKRDRNEAPPTRPVPGSDTGNNNTTSASQLSTEPPAPSTAAKRGVPLVKATAPGDENRDKKQVEGPSTPGLRAPETTTTAAAATKQPDAASLMYPSVSQSFLQSQSLLDDSATSNPVVPSQPSAPSATSSQLSNAIRRFKLSRPVFDGPAKGRSSNDPNVGDEGMQKRGRNVTPAVLVENFDQSVSYRRGDIGEETVKKRRVFDDDNKGIDAARISNIDADNARETPAQFPSSAQAEDKATTKPKLKHLPKPQNSNAHKPRSSNIMPPPDKRDGGGGGDNDERATKSGHRPDDMQDEDDYIYDEFIRRPVYEIEPELKTSLFQNGQFVGDAAGTAGGVAVPRNIGLLSITEDDVEYWEEYLDDSGDPDEEWYSEDEDSNAEDNPANDYPDEPHYTYDSDDSERPYMSDGDEDLAHLAVRYGINLDDDDDDDYDYDEDYLSYNAALAGSTGAASDDEAQFETLLSLARRDKQDEYERPI